MTSSWIPRSITCFVVGVMMLASSVAIANDQGDDVVQDFVSHVRALEIDDQMKADVLKLVEELRSDEYSQIEAISSALMRIYPEYEQALQSANTEGELAVLDTFVESSDKFLAADASFFLARSLMNEQRFEEALPVLEHLSGDLSGFTLYAGPAVYFCGVAQASLLENQRAITSFTNFLQQYEDAPERLRVAAWQQMQTIQSIEEGAMNDVLQRMDYSRRRLEIQNTDESTQTQQDKIVGMLAKLIREQEKRECSSCNSQKNCEGQQESQGQGQGQGEGEGQGQSTAGGTSNNPNGVAQRTYDDGPASPWSQLRQRMRDAANNSVKQKLPPRYRNVVEGYYESNGDEDR